MSASQLRTALLKQIVPSAQDFYPEQAAAIERLLDGKSTLCLMPTGRGKSAIFQYAALQMGKSALVFSPLRALMSQQDDDLRARGFASAAPHSIADYRRYYDTLRSYLGGFPSFLYISAERAAADGMLEYVLAKRRTDLGVIVIDESHCVSEWGETFRPLYRMIPRFLDGIFGPAAWPPVLCLTATLKPSDQRGIISSFRIPDDGVVRSDSLRRDNIALRFEPALPDQAGKEQRLEELLRLHAGQKTIVYAHLVSNKESGTEALARKFRARGFVCDYFDAQRSEAEKQRVLQEFASGSLPIVFATSAFGMGIHIPDIRVVIHYLIPESVEQYYQEVGRAGRDGLPSSAYLLYTPTNLKIRRHLVSKSVPAEGEFDKICSGVFPPKSSTFDPYRDRSEDSHELRVFVALVDAGVLEVIGKGPDSIRCFDCAIPDGTWTRYTAAAARTGSVELIGRRLQLPPSAVIRDLFDGLVAGSRRLAAAPRKVLFYRHGVPVESKRELILGDFERIRAARLAKLDEFVNAITGPNPEARIYEVLSI